MSKSGALSKIKTKVAPRGTSPRVIWAGLFRGIRMNLDLSCRSQLFLGLFEREISPWVARLSTHINTAVDIGAGEGEYTLYFLLRSPASRVLAFEPSAVARAQLEENLVLNGSGTDRLFLSSKSVGLRDSADECTLDSALAGLPPPYLIKMDVDGGEADILLGAGGVLATKRAYWIIETHSLQLERRCVEILTRRGYLARVVPNAWWRIVLPEQRPSAHNRWLVATPCQG